MHESVLAETLDTLRRHCIRGLTPGDVSILQARIQNSHLDGASRQLHLSLAQFRRRWDRLRELMLVPAGLPPHDDLLAGAWLVLHAQCCIAPAMAVSVSA